MISRFAKMFDEVLVGYLPALLQSVYGLVDFSIYMSIVDHWLQIIMFDDVWWDQVDAEFHVFLFGEE